MRFSAPVAASSELTGAAGPSVTYAASPTATRRLLTFGGHRVAARRVQRAGPLVQSSRPRLHVLGSLPAPRHAIGCQNPSDLHLGYPGWLFRHQANSDSPGAEKSTIILAPQFAPTLIIYKDVVAFAGGRQLNVVSAADGHELWRSDYAPSNYSVPVDLFGFGGRLWGPDVKMNLWRPLDDNIDFNAYDPLTGSIEKHVGGKYGYRFQHHRCHQMKVVGHTVIAGRAGMEFLDTDTGHVAAHHWTRGSCYYGVMPADGAPAWRFLACPEQRLIVSRGQLESVWPVSGAVLVVNDLAYFAAGRSSYLDGGLRLYGLESQTGRKVVDKVLSTLRPDGSELLDEQGVDGFLNDILSSDGKRIFMRHHVFDAAGNPKSERVTHLHGPDGYLSADTTSRLLWTYAPMYTSPHQGAFYDARLSRMLFPSGRILVEGDDTIYGYGQNHYDRSVAEPGGQWGLFAAPKQSDVPLNLSAREYRKLALGRKSYVRFRWWKRLPIQARAMVLAGKVLFVAGPPGSPLTSRAALEGKVPASLLAVSTADGSVLADMTLPGTPVWDGMASAGGNLYLALTNGDVLCLWPPDSGRPGPHESQDPLAIFQRAASARQSGFCLSP